MSQIDDFLSGRHPQDERSGSSIDDFLGVAPKKKREKRESQATAGDYARAIDSGLAEGVVNLTGGIGTFIQDPAANTLAGVIGAAHLADRGITWLLNKAGVDAEVNPTLQEHARLSSRFAAESRDAQANDPTNLPARFGRLLQEDSERAAREIKARDQATNPELIAQQQNMGQAEGFMDNLAAIKDNPLAFTRMLSRSAPDMALGVGVGATLHRAGAGLGTVSTAGTLAEAGSSAMQGRQGVYQAVMDMPMDALIRSPRYQEVLKETGGDRAKARQILANELADQVPLLTGAGTAMGTVLTNRLFGGDSTAKTIAGAERMTAKEFGKRTLQDTVEEGVQGVPEDTVQYGATVQADPNQEYDPGGSLAQNLAAGLAMGAGGHGYGYVRDNMGRLVRKAAPAAPTATPPAPVDAQATPASPAAAPAASAPAPSPAPAADPTARLAELEILSEQRDLTPAEREEAAKLLATLSQDDALAEAGASPAPAAREVDPIQQELDYIDTRLNVITPANGYGPAFDQEREELAARRRELLEQQRAAQAPTVTQPAPAGDAPVAGAETTRPTQASPADFWSFAKSKGYKPGDIKVGTPEHAALKAEYDALKAGKAEPILPPLQPQPSVDLQNRDRSRAASVVQMSDIARNPDYMRLGPSRTPDSGAPMVFAVGDDVSRIPAENFGRQDVAVMSDGQRVPFRYAVVDATNVNPSNFADGRQNPEFSSTTPGTIKALNNGRTAGVRAAHEMGTAGEYVAGMQADEAMHGIPADVIARTPNPMLVRVYSDAANTANMAAKSQGQGLGMSPAELARQDAPLLDTTVLSVYEPGEITSAANRDFVRAFIGKLQAAGQDVAGMMTGDGQLSQDGRKRIQAALMQAAYGDVDLVEEMFDSTDTDIKAIGEALKAVAGQWANMRDSARLGAINPQVDVTENLVQAVNLIRKARRERMSLKDLVAQPDLMTGETPDALTVGMLRVFYDGANFTRAVGRDKVVARLEDYIRAAMATSADAGLFGGEPVSPADILATIIGQGALDAQTQPEEGRGEPAGSGDPGVGAGEARPAGEQPDADRGGRASAEDRGAEPRQDAAPESQQQDGQGDPRAEEGNGAQAAARAGAGQQEGADGRAAAAKGRAGAADGQAVKAKKPKKAAKPKSEPDALPADQAQQLERDFRTFPTQILNNLLERGEAAKLYKAAGVKGAGAFDDLAMDDKAAAYVKFVQQGGKPVENLPKDYNAWVKSEERAAEVRRLQSDRVVRQENGKPFKSKTSAQQYQERYDLTGTHEVVEADGGFELRQLSPAAQAELKRKAEGRESYTEAQAAVAAEMGIGQTPDGEWDATDEQFDEMERRVQARMRGEPAEPKPEQPKQGKADPAPAPEPEQVPAEASRSAGAGAGDVQADPLKKAVDSAYRVANGYFGRDFVSRSIQNDWQRLLDAAGKKDVQALSDLESKYRKDEELDGLGVGTSGAGPGKVKQARRGAAQIPRFAREIRQAIVAELSKNSPNPNASAEPLLTNPTREDVLAQQQRAENAQAADEREQIRRESEAGAGTFSLEMQDGRQDTTADLFRQTAAERAQAAPATEADPFNGLKLPDQVKEYLLKPSVTLKDGKTVSPKEFVDGLLAEGYGDPEYFAAAKGSQVGFISKPGSPRVTLNDKQMFYADAAFMAKKKAGKAAAAAATVEAQANGDDTPMMRRGGSSGMPESMVRQVADTITSRWAQAPDVVVVQNMQDMRVPEAARQEDARQRAAGATGVPRGFYHRGTVYLVADGLKSVTDAAETLFHEALGHYGLRAVFGSSLVKVLDDLAAARPDLMRPKAKEYGKDLKVLKQRREVAEEVLAGMAQTKPNLGFVKRAIAAIRTWLRQNVPYFKDLALTDAEIINSFILPARGYVERARSGSASVTRNVEPAPYQRGSDGRNASADMASGIAESASIAQNGIDGLDVPAQRMVLASVLRSLEDRKVLDAVVELIPVEVVNDLTGEKVSSKRLLNDGAMLKRLLRPANGNEPITSRGNAASALVRAVASIAAKHGIWVGHPIRATADGFAAMDAGNFGALRNNVGSLTSGSAKSVLGSGRLVGVTDDLSAAVGAGNGWHDRSLSMDQARGWVERGERAMRRNPAFRPEQRELGGVALSVAGGQVPEQSGVVRVIYRGTNDSGERISGGIAEGTLFAAADEATARNYAGTGGKIERIGVKQDAKVLVEGTKEFAQVTGRRRGKLIDTMRKGENLKTAADDAAAKARAAGYDALEFTSFKDLGIAIFNEDKFVRDYSPSQQLNQSPAFDGPEVGNTPIGDATEIEVDGVQRPTTNSNGQPIAATEEGIRNFWQWFSPQPSQLLEGLSVSEIRSLERHTKALADFIERQSSLPKTDRFKVIPRPVLTHMVGVVNNDKILDAVIRSIPVDVVDFLSRKKWSAKEALHDVSVLEDVLTVDPETDVSFGVNPSSYPELTVRLMANAGAKITGLTGGALERNSAVLANENDPVLGAHVAKSPNKDLGILAGFGDSKVVDEQGRPLVVYRSNAVDSVLSGKPQLPESGMDGLRGNAELVSNLLQSPTFRLEGLGGFDAPTQRVVLAAVRGFGLDPEVLRSVVQFVPVDVVNILARKQYTAESLFSNQAVLKKLLAVDGNGSVSAAVDVADALVSAVAGVTAEDSGLVGLLGGARESDAASGARHGYLAVSAHGLDFKPIGNRGTFDSSKQDIRFSRSTLGNTPPTPPQNPNAWQKLKAKVLELTSPDAIESQIYEHQDKHIDLKRLRDHIKELGGTITDLNDAYLGEELYHKRLAKRTQDFLSEELKPLLADMRARGVDMPTLERYLHARHAPEANRVLAERNPNAQMIEAGKAKARAEVKALEVQLQRARAQGTATKAIEQALEQAMAELDRWTGAQAFKGTEAERLSLSGMSDAEAAAFMGGLPAGQRVHLEALAARVDAMQAKTLEVLEKYGLMDKATLDAWRSTYQFYVPLHRDEAHPDAVSHPIGQGFSTKGDASKRRTGSNEKVTNILAHIAMQREAALTRGEKNRVAKKLYLMAAQNPDPEIWSVDKPPMMKTVDRETGFVRTTVDPTYRNKPNVVMVRIGAKDHAIVFNERNPKAVRMAQSIKGADVGDLNAFESIMGKATRWLASVNTQYNPIFGIFNFARDVQAAILQLSTTPLKGQERAVAAYVPAALKGIYAEVRSRRKGQPRGTGQWAKLWEDMQDEGGTTGYRELFITPDERVKALTKELNALERGKASEAAHAVVDWLADYNETMENAVRLAAYKVALDQGMSKERAASLAKNLTVNFNRRGRQTARLGAYYAFLNAAIQGTARMVETLRGPLGRKIMLGGVMLGAVNALIGMAMMGGDDGEEDNWEKIPDFVKERSLIVPLGREDYLAIPMPLGYHVFPNLGRKAVEMMMHDDPTKGAGSHIAEMLRITLDAFNPLGGSENLAQMVTPTPFDPAVALMMNRDWTGKPIYREDSSNLDPTPGHQRTKDTASGFSKAVSEALNKITGGTDYQPGAISWTPDQIDYVIGQITGGLGREIMKLENTITAPLTGDELPAYKIPLVGRLYGNTRGPANNAELFYEHVRELNKIENEIRGRARDGGDVAGYMAEEPLSALVGMGNAAENQIRKLRQYRAEVVRRAEPGYQDEVKRINEQMGEVMKLLNQEVRRAKKEAAEAP